MYLQTGDVLYFKSELPKKAEKLETDIFHKGENHTHKVRGNFNIYKLDDDLFLECIDDCELYHEEHHSIVAKAGVYKKRIVVEYDHLLEESRAVID